MLRLFGTGHHEEERVIAELRSIGLEVVDRDPDTKKQWRFTALGGHLVAYLDAALLGLKEAPKTWHLLEVKTSNTAKFKEWKKKGVEVTAPQHFAQMMICMGLAKLTRAVYFMVCKETDLLDLERVKFDRKTFEALLERAERIIRSPAPLTRASSDPFSPPCGFCDFKEICHEEAMPDVNCRTCAHSTPLIDDGDAAAWRCDLTGEILSLQAQERACGDHLYIPPLIPYAEPIDGGDDWVLYQIRKKDQRFVNVAESAFPGLDVPHYGSRELKAVPPDAIGNDVVEGARETFGSITDGSAQP